MFDNKYLVNIYVLSLDTNFEVYLPANEKVGNITKLMNTTMFDSINTDNNIKFINADTGKAYNNNDLIRDTDIKNDSRILLI
ncbi:MAG: hypothetical protein IJK67_00185 [Bacilli bacterium]|nr:hypothetical protein [Bacilli bacterium]